jgi:hypothetical protein
MYNILSYDNQYDVTIGNFPGCSCVYFVTMLPSSLSGPGTYVQCKHASHLEVDYVLWAHGILHSLLHVELG